MHCWSFEFARACGILMSGSDDIMNSKTTQNSKTQKSWLLRFCFEQVPSIFIRNFLKFFPARFCPGLSSLFICCFQSPCFHRGHFNLPGVTFCVRLSIFLNGDFRTFFWRSVYALLKFWFCHCLQLSCECQWPFHDQQRLQKNRNCKVLTYWFEVCRSSDNFD